MPASTPLEAYTARHREIAEAVTLNRLRNLILQVALVFLLGLTLSLAIFALRGTLSWGPFAGSTAALSVVLYAHFDNRRRRNRLDRLLELYNAAFARLDGIRTGHTGEEFRTATHLYDRDLGVLGPDSLFSLLATPRTGVGRRGLARDLLEPHSRDSTLSRQLAVQELALRLDLREAIHLLGTDQRHQVAATFFNTWLEEAPPAFHPAMRPLLVLTSGVLVGGLMAGLWHLVPWSTLNSNLLLAFAAQCLIGFYLRPRVVPILNSAAHLSNQMRMFEDGLALLQNATFASPHLTALQHRSRYPHDAVPALKQIQSQFVIVEQRAKGWFLIASLLTNAGTHAAMSIAAWKRRHASAMEQWLAAWAEFESLNALATYAFEHPGYAYPEILLEGAAVFEAAALAHPLLPASAIPNDILLGGAQAGAPSLYLISGSNMAGKSTLLRAIGLNAVLAAAGAPIRAASARVSPLAVGASLALTDSLAEGKSKFLAEVERLGAILQLAEQPTPLLFLIDEIFSGTNSLDRRVAAEAVTRALVERRAIGALSTHDLTLTEMAADPGLRAANVHMASQDPADPLAFDYRLKPGVNPSSNAAAILRLMGIPFRP